MPSTRGHLDTLTSVWEGVWRARGSQHWTAGDGVGRGQGRIGVYLEKEAMKGGRPEMKGDGIE